MDLNIHDTPAHEIGFDQLLPFIGQLVIISVASGMGQEKNTVRRIAGTVIAVDQIDPESQHRDSGDGSLILEGRVTAHWGKRDIVSIHVPAKARPF